MKKLLSILLTVIILSTSLIIMPANASTAQKSVAKKPYETTYDSTTSIFGNSYGTVYRTNHRLVFRSKKNKEVTLVRFPCIDGVRCGYEENINFYMRGKTLCYTDSKGNLYYISINGKNRRKIASNIGTLLGGYGYYNIAIKGKTIYKIGTNGKKIKLKTLLSNVYNVGSLFAKKLYCPYKKGSKYYVYNLKTGKSSTFKYDFCMGKLNLYYLKKFDLMRMDSNGKVKKIETGVHKLYNCNDGSTVVYSKINRYGEEIFFRKTANNKAKKLCTLSDIKKALKNIANPVIVPELCTGKYLNGINQIAIAQNQICFSVSHNGDNVDDGIPTDVVLSVYKNGGKPKCFLRNYAMRIYNMDYANNLMWFDINNYEDFHEKFIIKAIK